MPSSFNDIDQGRENELQALHLIHRFGWLRPQEIGRYIWPGSKHTEMYGVRLGIKLQKSNLVIARKLPSHCGTALTLSKSGAKMLNDVGIDAKTGKDIGKIIGKYWIPRNSWEHDLLAASFLILLREKGRNNSLEIFSENEIRKNYISMSKIPDGIVYHPSGSAFFVEVENSKKSGPNMFHMIHNAIRIAKHGQEILGKNCHQMIFAFPEHAQDTRQYKIDHRLHIINSLKQLLAPHESIQIHLFKLRQKSGAAVGFQLETLEVESDELLRDAQHLYLSEYDEQNKCWFYEIDIPQHIAIIKKLDNCYEWGVEWDHSENTLPPPGTKKFKKNGPAPSMLGAKKCIAKCVREYFHFQNE